ncbi:hypothetical protein Aph02nite_66870 [Actinoplanes philippinensis]|uniref:Uncharacterized protein n=1 Tax=Actinoplanes philippinensis TaxID=35752 RepID=A0A1I2L3W8_9ACTN|nr:hypothetical protein [Actinoplanes philippinensis]GIE80737.1 hypothetical protein Aph02nite_66870 [Actinoplanes philippinensis]SFF72137.1 hypothetical protein SAMN05421541_11957 [Actinoplanes philippinensis]
MPERGHLMRTLVALAVTLVAGAALLFGAPAQSGSPQPLSVAAAWPRAQRGSVPSHLPDGSLYTPGLFFDARTSAGTARTADTKFLRLVVVEPDRPVRELRRVPSADRSPFTALTGSGDTLVWVETVKGKPELWTGDRAGRTPARLLTADVGALRLYDSEYDLTLTDGLVRWAAADRDGTEFRSVPVGGGPVTTQRAAGDWGLSAWPWAVDGQTAATGASTLRNLDTGQTVAVPTGRRSVTACSPAWCELVSINEDGDTRIELSHPDGSARRTIAEGTVGTVISDVVVLDRFEVMGRVGPQSELSGNQELLLHDLTDRSTVLVSPDAADISYRAGVLWWSTGDRNSYVRNSLDLRTV